MAPLNATVAARAATCPICGDTFRLERNGRKRTTCSDRCRKEASRRQNLSRNGEQASLPTSAEFVTKRPELDSEISGLQTQKTDLGKAGLLWIKVNDITWKLTDGEISRTPASFGQWGGYNTERALAWVIDTGWPKPLWYARRKDRSWGPTTSLAQAKKAALGFVTGVAPPQDEHARAFIGEIDLCAVILPPDGDES